VCALTIAYLVVNPLRWAIEGGLPEFFEWCVMETKVPNIVNGPLDDLYQGAIKQPRNF
jgi:hypothetical protein